MHLDFGPVARSLRRQPAVLSLLILEIAAGVATIGSLLISGAWYGHVGDRSSGLEEENLVLAAFYSPRTSLSSPPMSEQREADGRRLRAVPGVQAVTILSVTSIDDKWSYPSLFRGREPGLPVTRAKAWGGPSTQTSTWPRHSTCGSCAGAMPPVSGITAVGPRAAVLTRCLAERLFGSGTPGVGASRLAVGALLSAELTDEVPIAGVVEDVGMRVPFLPHARCVAFVLGGQPDERESRYVVRVRPGQRAMVLAALREAFAEDARRRYVNIRPFDSANSSSRTESAMGWCGCWRFSAGWWGWWRCWAPWRPPPWWPNASARLASAAPWAPLSTRHRGVLPPGELASGGRWARCWASRGPRGSVPVHEARLRFISLTWDCSPSRCW